MQSKKNTLNTLAFDATETGFSFDAVQQADLLMNLFLLRISFLIFSGNCHLSTVGRQLTASLYHYITRSDSKSNLYLSSLELFESYSLDRRINVY